MSWRNSICMYAGVPSCPDVNSLVCAAPTAPRSAIDSFYAATNVTLTRVDPNYFAQYGDDFAGLLLVGLISSTENYYRDIIGFILDVCPSSRAWAADEKVQLGSLLWARGALQNRSALEFMAFSSADNIKKTLNCFTNYVVKQHGDFNKLLNEYDKLCELRHAAVHSGHIVAGKNAIKLGLRPTSDPLRVKLGYAEIQSAGSICTALVQAANNELYEEMIKRWATEWRSLPSWDALVEAQTLEVIHKAFYSDRDSINGSIPNVISITDLLAAIKLDFQI